MLRQIPISSDIERYVYLLITHAVARAINQIFPFTIYKTNFIQSSLKHVLHCLLPIITFLLSYVINVVEVVFAFDEVKVVS